MLKIFTLKKFGVFRPINLISIDYLAKNSIDFYSGTYVTNVCDMVTVLFTVLKKVQNKPTKTNILTHYNSVGPRN